MEEGVIMSQREVFIYEQIEKFLSGKLKKSEVALLIGRHPRTVSRLARKVESKGLVGVKHGNCFKEPVNKKSPLLKNHVCRLIRDYYFDFNISHIKDQLEGEHGISIPYTTLRRWCHEIKVVKKKYRKKPANIRKKRKRMAQEGYLLQMDGSPHLYNGSDEWSLIIAIDDATSRVPYGEFFKAENTVNCMKVLEEIIKLHGRPWGVYVDRAGWLGGGKRQDFGEFRRACHELGIEVIFANSPQGKGRVERWFQVAQDRLAAELRLHKIKGMREANTYLRDVFLKDYWNKKHTVEAVNKEPAYRPLPEGANLNEIFSMRYYRKINYDHTFRWKGSQYQILNPPSNIAKQEVELRFYKNGESRVYFAGRALDVERVQESLTKKAS